MANNESDTLERMYELLPYYMKKHNNHIYYKALSIIQDEIISQAVEIMKQRNLNKAKGFALDIIGDIVALPRNMLDDDEYRKMIKLQIIINNSTGTIENINNICKTFLGEDIYIGMKEGWNDVVTDNEPALIRILLRAEEFHNDKIIVDKRYNVTGATETSSLSQMGTALNADRIKNQEDYIPDTTRALTIVPFLKKTFPIGVRYQYGVNFKTNVIRVNTESNLKWRSSQNKTIVKSVRNLNIKRQQNIKINNEFRFNMTSDEKIAIKSNGPKYTRYSLLQTGTAQTSRAMGIVL
ncbi:DUF2612 domain-containing protein [Clostridium botulinum]|uniref:DUF2612 domain-containing protein n=1 Tax=Clostridium botulinum TaxID=1491 RepID=UPI00077454BB|nr:DUF2612 domain-containing protein [Clostridium botulinum]